MRPDDDWEMRAINAVGRVDKFALYREQQPAGPIDHAFLDQDAGDLRETAIGPGQRQHFARGNVAGRVFGPGQGILGSHHAICVRRKISVAEAFMTKPFALQPRPRRG